MTAVAAIRQNTVQIERIDTALPILVTTGRAEIAIRSGTTIEIDGHAHAFAADAPITLVELAAGEDYGVALDRDGKPYAALLGPPNPLDEGWFAGFHFAPGACAVAVAGGDAVPTINPYSIWDVGFRPNCADPRGMTIVETAGGKPFWADIYLLGVDHRQHGTSRCGATIADGRDLPMRTDGDGRFKKLDYATATEIYAHHGKRLLGAEEFFAAAYGVEERCSRDDEPKTAGELVDRAHRFIGQRGLFDVTGTMWQWGTDGHPDNPRPCIFGGSWVSGDSAGSRYASLDFWPEYSNELISARGGSDHLKLD